MRYLVTITLIFTWAITNAQVNIVLNPSFEEYANCPNGYDEIKFATGWNGIDTTWSPGDSIIYEPFCLPEFCHTCSSNFHYATVPVNDRFYQYPRTGNGLAEVQMYYADTFFNQRDYLQGRLFSQLQIGKSYCVTFYVSLADESRFAINNIGAYFDNGSIDSTDSCSLPLTQYIPQINNQNIISDKVGWTKIEGVFIANGEERFITIGNFFSSINTSTVATSGTSIVTWYLIDDVSVIESELPAEAGDDGAITAGDSAFIGRQPEVGLECVWHTIAGDSVGAGAGIWVKPMQTTTYVVTQTLCGVQRYDTVTVYVWNVGVNNVPYDKGFSIAPNPVKDKFSLASSLYNNEQVMVDIYDMAGRRVMQQVVVFGNGRADVAISLNRGLYMVVVNDERGGRFLQKMLVQ